MSPFIANFTPSVIQDEFTLEPSMTSLDSEDRCNKDQHIHELTLNTPSFIHCSIPENLENSAVSFLQFPME
jgi:hypothetical protein